MKVANAAHHQDKKLDKTASQTDRQTKQNRHQKHNVFVFQSGAAVVVGLLMYYLVTLLFSFDNIRHLSVIIRHTLCEHRTADRLTDRLTG